MKKELFQVTAVTVNHMKFVCYTGTFKQCVKETERILTEQRKEIENKPVYSREYRDAYGRPYKYEIETIL